MVIRFALLALGLAACTSGGALPVDAATSDAPLDDAATSDAPLDDAATSDGPLHDAALDDAATSDAPLDDAALDDAAADASIADAATSDAATSDAAAVDAFIADAAPDADNGPPGLRLISARDHIEGGFLTPRTVTADATRIYLVSSYRVSSTTSAMFVLARSPADNFPLVQTIQIPAPSLVSVHADAARVYVTTVNGELHVFLKGATLTLETACAVYWPGARGWRRRPVGRIGREPGTRRHARLAPGKRTHQLRGHRDSGHVGRPP